MPKKGCPNCHNNTWQTCPKCGEIYCHTCGKNRDGIKRKAGNHCSNCDYIGGGWTINSKAPSWGTY